MTPKPVVIFAGLKNSAWNHRAQHRLSPSLASNSFLDDKTPTKSCTKPGAASVLPTLGAAFQQSAHSELNHSFAFYYKITNASYCKITPVLLLV